MIYFIFLVIVLALLYAICWALYQIGGLILSFFVSSDEAYELRENIIWAEELGLSKDSTEFLIRQIRAKIHAKYHHPDRYQILMATK